MRVARKGSHLREVHGGAERRCQRLRINLTAADNKHTLHAPGMLRPRQQPQRVLQARAHLRALQRQASYTLRAEPVLQTAPSCAAWRRTTLQDGDSCLCKAEAEQLQLMTDQAEAPPNNI